MFDPDEPQKPGRPVLKPSVWSPRPIPTPAPERRTADAKTPKLRELQERARQRASLVANPAVKEPVGGGPKPRPVASASPCTATGLATPERVAAYERSMQQLLAKDWLELRTTPKRVERIRDIINTQLRDAGVPEVRVRAAPALGATGYFFADAWRLDVDDGALGPEGTTLSRERQLDLMRTVYHEARHAEQSYLVARSRAALGETPDAYARALGMNDGVAAAATRDPLRRRPDSSQQPSGSPEMGAGREGAQTRPSTGDWADDRGGCADKWYRSVAGEDSAARQQLLRVDMPAKVAASNTAFRTYEAATKEHGDGSPEQTKAWRAFQMASKETEEYYGRYRKLPEEADAWAVQSLIK